MLIASLGGPGDLSGFGVAFSVVAVALPLLLPQPKRPPEPDKSPGPPKLAIKIYLARVISLVRPPNPMNG